MVYQVEVCERWWKDVRLRYTDVARLSYRKDVKHLVGTLPYKTGNYLKQEGVLIRGPA